jgi:hypothetical protein
MSGFPAGISAYKLPMVNVFQRTYFSLFVPMPKPDKDCITCVIGFYVADIDIFEEATINTLDGHCRTVGVVNRQVTDFNVFESAVRTGAQLKPAGAASEVQFSTVTFSQMPLMGPSDLRQMASSAQSMLQFEMCTSVAVHHINAVVVPIHGAVYGQAIHFIWLNGEK